MFVQPLPLHSFEHVDTFPSHWMPTEVAVAAVPKIGSIRLAQLFASVGTVVATLHVWGWKFWVWEMITRRGIHAKEEEEGEKEKEG